MGRWAFQGGCKCDSEAALRQEEDLRAVAGGRATLTCRRAKRAERRHLFVLRIPVKVNFLRFPRSFLACALACSGATAAEVKVERPQRSEDERP
jgi:hypothetical protein